jgi:tRNA uridine 5-carboxymethylaminomethyl modification enzyme
LTVQDRPLLSAWLKRPEANLESIRPWLEGRLGASTDRSLCITVETELKYEGYLLQQEKLVGRLKESESRKIPVAIVYQGIPGLSREVCDRLERVRPATLGQAARIPGVTPAAVAVLDCYISLMLKPSKMA